MSEHTDDRAGATKTGRQSRVEMVYRSTLKERFGLTDSLIKKLGKPSKTVPNPHYRSGPPSQLFSVRRVQNFIAKHADEIAAAAKMRPDRSLRARAVSDKKRAQLIAEIEDAILEWGDLPKDFETLRGIAQDHAQDRHGSDCAPPGWNGIYATVRHEFTNYEEILAMIRGKIGVTEAYETLRDRLDREISERIEEAYPNAPDRLL